MLPRWRRFQPTSNLDKLLLDKLLLDKLLLDKLRLDKLRLDKLRLDNKVAMDNPRKISLLRATHSLTKLHLRVRVVCTR